MNGLWGTPLWLMHRPLAPPPSRYNAIVLNPSLRKTALLFIVMSPHSAPFPGTNFHGWGGYLYLAQ